MPSRTLLFSFFVVSSWPSFPELFQAGSGPLKKSFGSEQCHPMRGKIYMRLEVGAFISPLVLGTEEGAVPNFSAAAVS